MTRRVFIQIGLNLASRLGLGSGPALSIVFFTQGQGYDTGPEFELNANCKIKTTFWILVCSLGVLRYTFLLKMSFNQMISCLVNLGYISSKIINLGRSLEALVGNKPMKAFSAWPIGGTTTEYLNTLKKLGGHIVAKIWSILQWQLSMYHYFCWTAYLL